MATETANLAHLPEVDAPAPNTHTAPTPRVSVAPAEIAAGTGPHQHPTLIPPKITPVTPGVMENPRITADASGCRVTPYSPLGRHDTTGR